MQYRPRNLSSVFHLLTCSSGIRRRPDRKATTAGTNFPFAAIILSQMIGWLSYPPHALRHRRKMIPGVCQLRWYFFGTFLDEDQHRLREKTDDRDKLTQATIGTFLNTCTHQSRPSSSILVSRKYSSSNVEWESTALCHIDRVNVLSHVNQHRGGINIRRNDLPTRYIL